MSEELSHTVDRMYHLYIRILKCRVERSLQGFCSEHIYTFKIIFVKIFLWGKEKRRNKYIRNRPDSLEWEREPEVAGFRLPDWSLLSTMRCVSLLCAQTHPLGSEACSKNNVGDFPGGPVVKTPSSQSRGPGFDPWSRN